ncbi:MAG: hypothetical protein ACM3XM_00550, partial [Mycobacterium leprae]
KKGQTTFMGLGSTIYQLQQSPGHFGRDTEASQSRLMEVYADRVVVRSRDHTEGRWMDELTVTIQRNG